MSLLSLVLVSLSHPLSHITLISHLATNCNTSRFSCYEKWINKRKSNRIFCCASEINTTTTTTIYHQSNVPTKVIERVCVCVCVRLHVYMDDILCPKIGSNTLTHTNLRQEDRSKEQKQLYHKRAFFESPAYWISHAIIIWYYTKKNMVYLIHTKQLSWLFCVRIPFLSHSIL